MQAVIETQHLTKYYSARHGVEDLCFSIAQGEIFGYLGPNGSGKTTTIRLLLNFIQPTRGSFRLLGSERGSKRSSLRRRIGYLPGDLGLYERYSGRQLLSLYQGLSGGAAPLRDWLCEQLQISGDDLRRKVKSYSKGMKQKLGIVQALQHNPDLAILDEPTTGLDPIVQERFYGVLRELRSRGKTVFFSSHILSEVHRLCDRVAVLREGRLVRVASVSEMMASADRLLWLRLAIEEGAEPPVVLGAPFVRREGEWFLYRAKPQAAPLVLEQLPGLKPLDMRFEPAYEDSFLDFYREPKTSGGES